MQDGGPREISVVQLGGSRICSDNMREVGGIYKGRDQAYGLGEKAYSTLECKRQSAIGTYVVIKKETLSLVCNKCIYLFF